MEEVNLVLDADRLSAVAGGPVLDKCFVNKVNATNEIYEVMLPETDQNQGLLLSGDLDGAVTLKLLTDDGKLALSIYEFLIFEHTLLLLIVLRLFYPIWVAEGDEEA